MRGDLLLPPRGPGSFLSRLRSSRSRTPPQALSPSGDRLASASFDRSWKIWDVYDRRELLHVRGHDREAPCCCEIGLFGRCCRSVRASCPVTGNSRAVESIAFSADGERVATGGADTAVMVWDARARRRQLLLSGHSGTPGPAPPLRS